MLRRFLDFARNDSSVSLSLDSQPRAPTRRTPLPQPKRDSTLLSPRERRDSDIAPSSTKRGEGNRPEIKRALSRLPACPPARLPVCPLARLPACPPARPHSPTKKRPRFPEAASTNSYVTKASFAGPYLTLHRRADPPDLPLRHRSGKARRLPGNPENPSPEYPDLRARSRHRLAYRRSSGRA